MALPGNRGPSPSRRRHGWSSGRRSPRLEAHRHGSLLAGGLHFVSGRIILAKTQGSAQEPPEHSAHAPSIACHPFGLAVRP